MLITPYKVTCGPGMLAKTRDPKPVSLVNHMPPAADEQRLAGPCVVLPVDRHDFVKLLPTAACVLTAWLSSSCLSQRQGVRELVQLG